jgi:hypothetical protein
VGEAAIEVAKSRKDRTSLTLRGSGPSRMVWTLAGSIVKPVGDEI